MAEKNETKYLEVDIKDFLLLLLRKSIFIIIAILIGVGVGFGVASNKKQMYRASALLYTNNYRSTAQDLVKYITSSDISASRSLIDVYAIIIRTKETLNDSFFENLNSNEELSREYSYFEISGMITVGAKNGTEILQVNVIGDNPHDIIIIANAISSAAKTRIEAIIQGTNIEIVEDAWCSYIIPKNTFKTCLIGGLIGFAAIFAIIFLSYITNNDIESEEWIGKCFGSQIPILAVVPDSVTSTRRRYGYGRYRRYRKYRNYEDYENPKDKQTENKDSNVDNDSDNK